MPNNTRPASELTREEYAARAGVPINQITGTFGNFTVAPATSTSPNVLPTPYVAPAMTLPNIPVSQINPQVPFQPVTVPPPTDTQGALAGTQVSLPQQTAVDTTQEEILKLMQEQGGQTAFQQQQEQAFGVPETQKAIKDLTTQLLSINTEAQQRLLELGKTGQPTFLTSEMKIREGNIERDRTIKALGISASIQALQGNLTLANDQVKRAVDLKYDPIKQQLELLNKQLEFNYNALTSAEKKEADKLKAANDVKLKELEIKRDEEKNFASTINTALSNAAPLSIVNQARTLYVQGNEDGARALLSKYTGTPSSEMGAGGGTIGEKRDYAVSTYLNSKKGTDGFVAAETYQQALKTFIAKGGTQSNFFASYPQQTYLRQQEIDKLPAAMKPQTLISKGDLTPEQTSIINDAKAAIDQVKQRYGDWGATRQQIIEQAKTQFNFDISPYI